MPKKQEKSKNIGLGFLFIFLVVLIIILSLTFKIFDVVSKSKFDGKSNFYILLKEDGKWEDIAFSPSASSITIINLKNKSTLSDIGFPYDLISDYSSQITKENFKSNIYPVLSKSNANPLDLMRIMIFVNQNSSSVSLRNIDSSSENITKIIPQLISDQNISSENLTIEISNATGVSGVGAVYAKMITYLGGNVILVSTDSNVKKTSEIIVSNFKSMTAKKLINMFNLRLNKSQAKLSDIKIVVGENLLQKINQ